MSLVPQKDGKSETYAMLRVLNLDLTGSNPCLVMRLSWWPLASHSFSQANLLHCSCEGGKNVPRTSLEEGKASKAINTNNAGLVPGDGIYPA